MRALSKVLTGILPISLVVAGTATATGSSGLQQDANAIVATGAIGVQARATTGGRTRVVTAGVAEHDTNRPVPRNGYVRIASTTKTFTATVILQLVGERRLSLTDPVERWLPGVVRGNGNDGRKITVRHLLQHTSGIHDDVPGFDTEADYHRHRHDVHRPEQLVARAMAQKPDFAPGHGWSYSNTGYFLLGMIIERITGRPWHEQVDRRIIEPLGLKQTYWPGLAPDLPEPHVQSYHYFTPERPVDVSSNREGQWGGAAYGLVGSTADVEKFYAALLGGRLLRPQLLRQMQQTVPVQGPIADVWPGARAGLGLFSRPLSCGGVYWSHGGDMVGFMSRNGFSTDGRRTAVVSISTERSDSLDAALAQDRAAGNLVDGALCR